MRRHKARRYYLPVVAGLIFTLVGLGCGGNIGDNALSPGQTDFVNNEPGNGYGSPGAFNGAEDRGAGGAMAPSGQADSNAKGAEPPNGRTGDVEEADIYRIDNNRLFYLNTYRGFVVYDLNDPKNPRRVGRLPVFGYPVEMFVKGDTIYALLRDALYLTQDKGKLKFERHNVSQLVTIDVSDLSKPRVLKKVDIIGQLREGVSRKIEDTIYVVSYVPQSYYWGWGYNRNQDQKEQAHVYSFNVADAKNPALVDKLKLFEGGSIQLQDKTTGSYYTRSFNGVSISATSNALMVVENWYSYGRQSSGGNGCSSYQSNQDATVSIVNISDPSGKISVHTKFQTKGHLTDQFKQTYIYDDATKTGTYYGIFARREWGGSNCNWQSQIQNTIESWDVSDGKNPQRLSELAFGKPNETVRGSTFDPERKVAFAITAQQIDPLYVISFADRTKLKVLSEIDGLSGDMNVFRFIDNKKFLMGIGRDTTDTCSGFQKDGERRGTNVAVSIIDVRDLNNIKLVQRQCVAVQNASWVSSGVNNNLDQAHKMIGMFSDGRVNAVTVPVYYYVKNEDNPSWWYYRYETAIGVMTWDTSKYDPNKSHTEQTVLQNYGTIIHHNGQVRRSIVFTHKGQSDRRMVVNLSDTHISIADIEDLDHPQVLSTVELAPYYSQLYKFGQYLVEQVTSGAYGYEARTEFRVKRAGADLESRSVVARFSVGQVQRAIKHGDNLVLFRTVQENNNQPYYYRTSTEVLVYDLSDPAAPRRAGSVKLTGSILPYYYYWCGVGGFWGGYWFDDNSRNWVSTKTGITFLSYFYDYQKGTSSRRLYFLDLQNNQAPAVTNYALTTAQSWSFLGLAPDPVEPTAFYLTYRTHIGQNKIGNTTFSVFKYYAQRWGRRGGKWTGLESINLPGRLIRTWATKQGQRMFLAHDYTYRPYVNPNNPQYTSWQPDFRLSLLRETQLLGQPVAELLDWHNFADFYLKDLVIDGDKIFVNAHRSYSYAQKNNLQWYDLSDHLVFFDTSLGKLAKKYSEATGTYNVRLMGTYRNRLFLNLPGDGVLVVDASNPSVPVGKQFVRTLGWASHIEFAGDTAFVASGNFGIYELQLDSPLVIANN
ncbi:MAG: beta-propeller domain-containing protein [Myxococcales bacterium]|nr:beta-propeller domain-containing protein [Myxococcales bacterium]